MKRTKQTNKELIKIIVLFIIAIILLYIICNLILATSSIIIALALTFLALALSIPNVIFLTQFFKQRCNCKYTKASTIIHDNLSSEYKIIYLNAACLKISAIPLHEQRIYMAKLEENGDITIRIENKNSDKYFEEQTSDYDWFLAMFRFSE